MKIALSFLAVGVLYASSTLAYIHTNISTEDSNRTKREDNLTEGVLLANNINARIQGLDLSGVLAGLKKSSEFGVLAPAQAADYSELANSDLAVGKAHWTRWITGLAKASSANHPRLKKLLAYLSDTYTARTDIPMQLRQLIPVGGSNLNLDGKTENGMPCVVNLSRSILGFSANAFLLDSRGEMILKTFAKFQIGLGHNLQSLKSSEGDLTAVSAHFAEESYSSDTRSTLVVRQEGEHIRSISIAEDEKGLFGWKSRIKTQCEF